MELDFALKVLNGLEIRIYASQMQAGLDDTVSFSAKKLCLLSK